MPASMFTKNKMFVTKKYLDYSSPIIGELPKFVTLDFKKK
jgi:hypothetical protein